MKLIFLIPVLLFITAAHSKPEVVAQFLWHGIDEGMHTISIANFDGENWGEQQLLHQTEFPLSSVSYGSDQQGNHLMVWTEQYQQKSLLMHKWYSVNDKVWSEVKLLSDFGIENIGSTVVFDLSGKAWVFWASNDLGLSDVVGMSMTAGQWGTPFLVNQKNQVPDITPNAALNEEGQIVVNWSQYSFDQGRYIRRSKVVSFDGEQVYKSTQNISGVAAADKVSPEDISPPNFAPNNAASIMHFPQNLMIQSLPVLPAPAAQK